MSQVDGKQSQGNTSNSLSLAESLKVEGQEVPSIVQLVEDVKGFTETVTSINIPEHSRKDISNEGLEISFGRKTGSGYKFPDFFEDLTSNHFDLLKGKEKDILLRRIIKYILQTTNKKEIYDKLSEEFGFPIDKKSLNIGVNNNSGIYRNLNYKSRKKIIKYKLTNYFGKKFKPIYIEFSEEDIKNGGFKDIEEFKIKKLREYKDIEKVYFINTDELKRDGISIEEYKKEIFNNYIQECFDDLDKKLVSFFSILKLNKNDNGKYIENDLILILREYKEYFLTDKFTKVNSGLSKAIKLLYDTDIESYNTLKSTILNFSTRTEKSSYLFLFNYIEKGADFEKITEIDISELVKLFGEDSFFIAQEKLYIQEELSGFSFYTPDFSQGNPNQFYVKFLKSSLKILFDKLGINIKSNILIKKLAEKNLDYINTRISQDYSNQKFNSDEYVSILSSEFSIKSNLNEREFEVVAIFLKKYIPEIELIKTAESSYSNGYISPSFIEGKNKSFKGFYCGLDNGLKSTNILLIEDILEGNQAILFNTNNISLDLFIFINTQIAYFIENKSFINPEQLFSNIYLMLAKAYLEASDTKIYDISDFQKQYSRLIETIIAPLSQEYKEKGLNISPENTVLAGIHGTGKSQVMQKLLGERTFEIADKSFTIDGSVIPLNMGQLYDILKETDNGVYLKYKIESISKNTGKPILVVLEDIDKYIENEDFEQSLTTFFEGLGSIGNLFVLTTTNHPEKFPLRLTRKNRFSNFIVYELFNENDLDKISSFFNLYIRENNLEEVFTKDLIEEYAPKFIGTTVSHIGDFIEKVLRKLEFKNILGEEFLENDIKEAFDDLHMNLGELRKSEDEMFEYIKRLKSKNGGSGKINPIGKNRN